MTPAKIEQLARDAGIGFGVTHIGPDGEERWASVTDGALSRFAALVRAAALTEAAEVCETVRLVCPNVPTQRAVTAAAIRALAQQAGGEAA